MSTSDAEFTHHGGGMFITEVDTQRASNFSRNKKVYRENGLLDQCRKENIKVKEVVNAFRSKIDNLIDKQRNEYISAYENHMQDVQKELYNLRELVSEIANNSTKKEKTSQLKDEGKHFKADALKLLAASDDLRQHIRALVKKTYKIEKSRDWLLQKLRSAKREYNMLSKEKSRLFDNMDDNLSLSQNSQNFDMMSQSVTSNYTMELEMMFGKKKSNKLLPSKLRSSMKEELGQSFNSNSHILLPDVKSTAPPAIPPKIPDPTTLVTSFLLPVPGEPEGNLMATAEAEGLDTKGLGGGKMASRSLLISGRRRREEVRDFLKLCSKSLHKGPWNRVHKRSLVDVVSICNSMVHHRVELSKEEFECNTEVLKLACELAAFPETYSAIIDIIDHAKTTKRSRGGYNDEQSEGDDSEEQSEMSARLAEDEEEDDPTQPYMGVAHNMSQGFNLHHLLPPRGISSPPRSPEHTKDVIAFKTTVEDIMHNSGARSVYNIPTRTLNVNPISSSIGSDSREEQQQQSLEIEPDLIEYLKQEKTNKTLQAYGYFEEDEFLHFK